MDYTKALGGLKEALKILPDNKLKMPHMGWNIVNPINNNKLINAPKDYYFVHSYYFECQNKENIMAESQYKNKFCFNCW